MRFSRTLVFDDAINTSTIIQRNHRTSALLGKAQYIQFRNSSGFISYTPKPVKNISTKITTERALHRQKWFTAKVAQSGYSFKNFSKHPQLFHASLIDDPLKLADYVRITLKKDGLEPAVTIVRDASRKFQCVVCWNHLIDWLMTKGEIKGAISIYQEMKKRAQIPDAHTFTIIFRGFSQNKHSKQALGRVLSIYQSMLLDSSPVKPNIIHMNAVLKMCSVAGDIDSMLSLVHGMPHSGPGAPDSITYATILNALRHFSDSRLPTFPPSPHQQRMKTQTVVLQALRIWKDVMKRWKTGDVWIDEELICAMGRLLLSSNSKKHWDEVLLLVEQTMGIPRQLPLFNSSLNNLNQSKNNPQQPVQSSSEVDITFKHSLPIYANSEVTSLVPYASKSVSDTLRISSIGAFAKPGNNALSLVLKALLFMSLQVLSSESWKVIVRENHVKPARYYWKIFTEEHHVEPDLDNYVSYLRILRAFRASRETVQFLSNMPQKYREPKVFFIALSCCIRDKKYQHRHNFFCAGKILDMMLESLKEPDIKTTLRYLNFAMLSLSYSTRKSKTGENVTLSDPGLEFLFLRAIDRVQEIIVILKCNIFFDDPGLEKKLDRHEFLVNFKLLIKQSISAHDRILGFKGIPIDLHHELNDRRAKLNHLETRMIKYLKSVGGLPTTKPDRFDTSIRSELASNENFEPRSKQNLLSY